MYPHVTGSMWPHGQTRAHVYVLPELNVDTELASLIAKARTVTEQYGECVAAVPDEWLHATVRMASDPQVDRQRLTEAVTHRLSTVPAFQMRMGSVTASNSAVLIDADETTGWTALHAATCEAFEAVDAGLDWDPSAPHISIGYGIGNGDSGPIASRLRAACRPPHALWRIRQAVLVEVEQRIDTTQDGRAHTVVYRWRETARIDLAGA